jgi:hypothetical protein
VPPFARSCSAKGDDDLEDLRSKALTSDTDEGVGGGRRWLGQFSRIVAEHPMGLRFAGDQLSRQSRWPEGRGAVVLAKGQARITVQIHVGTC